MKPVIPFFNIETMKSSLSGTKKADRQFRKLRMAALRFASRKEYQEKESKESSSDNEDKWMELFVDEHNEWLIDDIIYTFYDHVKEQLAETYYSAKELIDQTLDAIERDAHTIKGRKLNRESLETRLSKSYGWNLETLPQKSKDPNTPSRQELKMWIDNAIDPENLRENSEHNLVVLPEYQSINETNARPFWRITQIPKGEGR